MPTDLRLAEADYQRLRELFASSFRPGCCPETGAIGLLGECRDGDKQEFLLARLITPGPGDLKIALHQHLVFAADYIRRAHLEMRAQKLAGLVFFHTHPLANETVSFSYYDDREEPLLVENLKELDPQTRVVSIVAGRSSLCGRAWLGGGQRVPLDHLVVVGERLLRLPLNGQPAPPSPSSAALFDRGLALTSAGALALLSELKVAVIGASGTGSLICELLARAGCRSILVIDDDVSKLINLNRILYATQEDVDRQTPKVEILRRGIEGLGVDCRVEPVMGNILDRQTLVRLREADVLVGCVDRGFPRQLLCEFAYRYHRPYIDVGSEIGGDAQGIVSLDARASYVAPGRYCLACAGVVTPRQLHFESLSAEERARVLAQGYSDDLVIDQPAVMDLNMRAASTGMMLVRHLLQPFLLTPLPVMILENLLTYSTKAVMEPRATSPACPICQINRRSGYGDCGPLLGLDHSVLSAIRSGKAA